MRLPWSSDFHRLMLASWIAQNLAMPKPADPQQARMQKMMRFLPFVFLFLLCNYASGLSLYMTTLALIAIIQYKFLKITTPTA